MKPTNLTSLLFQTCNSAKFSSENVNRQGFSVQIIESLEGKRSISFTRGSKQHCVMSLLLFDAKKPFGTTFGVFGSSYSMSSIISHYDTGELGTLLMQRTALGGGNITAVILSSTK